jgi:tetratricopeptide (TPR) repeat protein
VEEAIELSARAFRLSADNSFARITIADELDERGLYQWAEREYRDVLAKEPALSSVGLDAAMRLTAMLYDIEKYTSAAGIADGFLLGVEEDDRDEDQNGFDLLDEEQLQRIILFFRTRAEFYRACHAHQQGDPITERKYLEQALQHDPSDIDVLIAMYRLPVDDVDFRSDVLRSIEEQAESLDAEIRQQPGYATNYNNWAWLIANTRGDHDKAIRYAHRAVEMAGQESLPGFLDTLGRAYFANGDYGNAVRYQRRAVVLEPHTQLLRRQLAEFEQAMK